jgi:hypothetical protein
VCTVVLSEKVDSVVNGDYVENTGLIEKILVLFSVIGILQILISVSSETKKIFSHMHTVNFSRKRCA